MRGHVAALMVALAMLAATALPAHAAPGDVDPSFGAAGVVKGPSGAARALILQPDGKLVAAGDVPDIGFTGSRITLARYAPDGTPDAGFGFSGVVTTPHLAFGLSASDERGEALAIQAADGRLVVAGTALDVATGYDFAVARYNPDGTLDTTFGSGGTATTDFAADTDWAKAVMIQPDQKIVLAGFSGTAFAAARYNADGTLDLSFGSSGTVVTPIPGRSSSIEAVARDALGRIVVAGTSVEDATGRSALALARYLANGALDPTFGVGGIALTELPNEDASANALLIQNGKPVVAGSRAGPPAGFLLARYSSRGVLDPGFGTGGLVTTSFPLRDVAGANALVQDSAGRLVAAGATADSSATTGPDFGLARYLADGSPDPSFGVEGRVIDDLGGGDEAQALQVQPDGRPVAAGFSDALFALTRYTSAAGGAAADLALSVVGQPEPVDAGALLSYTVTVTNTGPGEAAGVVATVDLADSSFERVRSDQGFCAEAAGTVRCNLRALLAGRSTTFTIVVTPNRAGTLTGSAAVTASTPDPDAANNSAVVSSTVTPAPGSWSAATSFGDGVARVFHTATVLADGDVLVAGGRGSDFAPLASAQLHGAAGWAPTSALPRVAGEGHTATLLQGDPSQCGVNCGKVLVAGGFAPPTPGSGEIATASAALYDPATGAWMPTGGLVTARAHHSATLLPSGKVLVSGGIGADSGTTGESLAQAELYDPARGAWTAVRDMAFGRQSHSATLLASGKVLVVGGYRGTAHDADPTGALAPPELYDPQRDTWADAGDDVRRREHTATLLGDGTVLVVGGNTSCGCPTAAAEIYDPAGGPTGAWLPTSSIVHARSDHTATLLRDGEVLVTGGVGERPTSSLRAAELYDPATGRWRSAGVTATPRSDHTASLLGDGSVLVAGGSSVPLGVEPLASVELYTPAASPPFAVPPAQGPPETPAQPSLDTSPAQPSRDTTAPRISSFSMLRRTFGVAGSRTAVSRRRGSAFRYTLSEQAVVRIAIERRLPGLRLRARRATSASCVPATRRSRRLLDRQLSRALSPALSEQQRASRLAQLIASRRCVRYHRVGALTRSARAGRNQTRFSGHVAAYTLRAGPYRAAIRAVDAAGNRSREARTTFRIVLAP